MLTDDGRTTGEHYASATCCGQRHEMTLNVSLHSVHHKIDQTFCKHADSGNPPHVVNYVYQYVHGVPLEKKTEKTETCRSVIVSPYTAI